MRRAFRWYRAFALILLAVPSVAPTVYSQSKSDEAAVRDVPRAFAAAWAKHDGNLLAKTMSDDVDFVNVGGDWLQGRRDFALYHSRLLSGRFKESVLTPLDISVDFYGRKSRCCIGVGESRAIEMRIQPCANRALACSPWWWKSATENGSSWRRKTRTRWRAQTRS
jgi:hypothetical protein